MNIDKTIHFIGIGGIGMSGIALFMHQSGYKVQGSDVVENSNVKRLIQSDIKVFVGHESSNIKDVDIIIRSTAIKEDNPEIIEAKNQDIQILHRADALAMIMQKYKSIVVAGTHGKTTTSSTIGYVLDSAGLDPTIVTGGIMNHYNNNIKIGNSNIVVVESDESDGSFVKLPVNMGIITNIDHEHLEYYNNDYDLLKTYFRKFISSTIEKGDILISCLDNKELNDVVSEFKSGKIFKYSINDKNADVMADNIKFDASGCVYDAVFKDGKRINNIRFNMPGEHNASNSLGVILLCHKIGLSDDQIKSGLKSFPGIKRRFTKIGNYKGALIIDDYAHHPREIEATISSACSVVKDTNGRVISVFQPHRYSRVKSLFNEFAKSFIKSDYVFVTDIYAASEKPIIGIDQSSIVNEIAQYHSDKSKIIPVESLNHIDAQLDKIDLAEKDIVLFLGAGDISNFAYKLVDL